jgi:putative transposase
MVRKLLHRSSYYPYHVTARSNNREWFYVPIEVAWNIFCDQLCIVSFAYGAKIHAFVLMSNHYHLLLSTPDANIDQIMNYFAREVSRAINQYSIRINHVFGGRYKACLIKNGNYYSHALRYIYRNPVRANICKRAEEYKFSTLHGIQGYDKVNLPLHGVSGEFRANYPEKLDEFESWVNITTPEQPNDHLISLALRKTNFSFPTRYKNKMIGA